MKCPLCNGSGKEWPEVMTTAAITHDMIPDCRMCDGEKNIPETQIAAKSYLLVQNELKEIRRNVQEIQDELYRQNLDRQFGSKRK